MKAIIKSILVLSLMIIFGPVTDSYAEALSSQEILEVCDDGLCDDQTLEVKTKQGATRTGSGRTIEEAKRSASHLCWQTAWFDAYEALKAQADKAIKDGKLKKCAEGCRTYKIHVPVETDVELTDITEFYEEPQWIDDSVYNFKVILNCTVKAKMTITRICVSESNQCIEQEEGFAELEKLLEHK